MAACEECSYFARMVNFHDSERGQCRRRAPVPYSPSHGKPVRAEWPTVARREWCGEFEEKR